MPTRPKVQPAGERGMWRQRSNGLRSLEPARPSKGPWVALAAVDPEVQVYRESVSDTGTVGLRMNGILTILTMASFDKNRGWSLQPTESSKCVSQ
ncbi:unnamed protein product [Lota lota]